MRQGELSETECLVLDVLATRPTRATRWEIARRLGISQDQVANALSSLGAAGFAARHGRRWTITGRGRSRSARAAVLAEGVGSSRAIRRTGGHRAPPDSASLARITSDPTWNEFRRLCRYYLECLRTGSGAAAKLTGEGEGRSWLSLDSAVDWVGLAAGRAIHVRRTAALDGFCRALKLGRKSKRLVIGGPVAVFSARGGAREAAPAFVTPIRATLDASHLILQALEPIGVNSSWFDVRFRRAVHEGEDLLIRAGYLENRSDSRGHEFADGVSLAELWDNLILRAPDEWVVTPRSLRQSERFDATSSGQGLYPSAVLAKPAHAPFTQGLMAELEEISQASDVDLNGTALRWLFLDKVSHEVDEPHPGREPAEITRLNEQQRRVCRLATCSPLLVVKGPPGTGKSTVVRHVMLNMLLDERSVLFASRNHRALDAVVPKLNELVDDGDSPLVIRLTPPKGAVDSEVLNWTTMITDLITHPSELGVEGAQGAYEAARAAVDLRGEAESAIQARISAGELLVDAESECAALEYPPGLDELVALSLPDLPTPSQLADLEGSFLQAPPGVLGALRTIRARIRARRLLAPFDLDGLLPRLPGLFGATREYGRALESWLKASAARDALVSRKQVVRQLASSPQREDLERELEAACRRLEAATLHAVTLSARSMGGALPPAAVQAFANLRGALHGQGGSIDPARMSRQLTKLLRSAFQDLLPAFPLWACSNLSLRSRLPLVPGAFDLVVVDEASQCDIASVIPLLYRARRAMIVGDPMQLRHVGMMSGVADARVRERLGLDDDAKYGRFRYGPNSIYDLASTSRQVIGSNSRAELIEHYRCHPAIAEYFGSAFYRGTLKVRTPFDRRMLKKLRYRGDAGMAWTEVSGASERRGSSRICLPQIGMIVAELTRLAREQFLGSIGVVTPFRAQADRIRDTVRQSVDPAILANWQFICETADGFQGDERDVVLFSLIGGGPQSELPSFYRSDVNRFNVAVSRARMVLHVFGEKDFVRTCGIKHLARLAQAHDAQQREREDRTVRWDLVGPVWEPAFAEAMAAAGITYAQQYHTCGYYLDFAIFANGKKVNVEIDGEAYHRDGSGERRLSDVYRDQVLKGSGWQVVRFWVYELREDIDRCVAIVRDAVSPMSE